MALTRVMSSLLFGGAKDPVTFACGTLLSLVAFVAVIYHRDAPQIDPLGAEVRVGDRTLP